MHTCPLVFVNHIFPGLWIQQATLALSSSRVVKIQHNSRATYGLLTTKGHLEEDCFLDNVAGKPTKKHLPLGDRWLVLNCNLRLRMKPASLQQLPAAAHRNADLTKSMWSSADNLKRQAAVRLPTRCGLGGYYNPPCWHIQTHI